MDIEITHENTTETRRYINVCADGQEVWISVSKRDRDPVNVIVRNASNVRNRYSAGRDFASFDAAVSNYKSAKVKAALRCAAAVIAAETAPESLLVTA